MAVFEILLLIWTVCGILSGSPVLRENSCSESALRNCWSHNANFMQEIGESETPLPDPGFFHRNCREIWDVLHCFSRYNETCGEVYVGLPFSLNALWNLFESMCNADSELAIGYRRSIPCLNEHKLEILDMISEHSDRIMRFTNFAFQHNRGEQPERVNFMVLCIGFRKFEELISPFLEATCGEEAKRTVRYLLLWAADDICHPSDVERYETLYENYLEERRQQQETFSLDYLDSLISESYDENAL